MQAFLDYTIMKGNNMLNIVPVGKGACNRSGRRANMGVALHELDATNRDLGRYATTSAPRLLRADTNVPHLSRLSVSSLNH
jgi:hypothetical protein